MPTRSRILPRTTVRTRKGVSEKRKRGGNILVWQQPEGRRADKEAEGMREREWREEQCAVAPAGHSRRPRPQRGTHAPTRAAHSKPSPPLTRTRVRVAGGPPGKHGPGAWVIGQGPAVSAAISHRKYCVDYGCG